MGPLWIGTRSVLRVLATRRITCRGCEPRSSAIGAPASRQSYWH